MSTFPLLFQTAPLVYILLRYSVAVFDVVKSSRKPSPFVLLQPRLRLHDILPSTIHHRDYSDDETAFVGLVPGTDSLFALSPDHFPLVAFSESAPTQRIEGSEGVVVSGEHGTLQCLEGTTDRQCLTGVRALRADSRSRLARLLDGVPGPATPPLTSTTRDPAHSENMNSQVYAESGPVIVPSDAKFPLVPWEWVASLPESLSQGRNSWAQSNSGLLLALVSVIGSLLWFNRKAPPDGHDTTAGISGGSAFGKLVHKTPADGNAVSIAPLEGTDDPTDTALLESQATPQASPLENTVFTPNSVVMPDPPNTASAPSTPTPPSATDIDIKDSPVKPEFQEGAEEAGEVKKKRKRRRRRKGDTKDATAEGGEEPENEDGEVGGDGTAVPPGTPSSVPSTQVPPASSSLVISDTVLGMLLSVTSNKLLLIKTRLRFAWYGRLHGFLARPCRGRQTSPSRLCYPRSP